MRRLWSGVTLALVMTVAGAGELSAQTSSIERALERAGRALERALDGMGRVMERAFDRGSDAVLVQAADDFRWTGRLDRGQILEVKGLNGDVVVERASGSDVEVTATAEARRSDPDEVRVELVEHGEGVTICAVYPTPRGERENYCAPGSEGRMNNRNNDTQVRFVVRLPEGVRLAGRTVNGDVEALGLASDVTLTTVNGDVDVATTGYAEASTVNGSIEARMGRMDPEGGLSFKTVNGSVTLDLPDDVDADLDARWVNGGLESDLPFRMEGRMTRHRAQGVLGRGGPELSVTTVNGSIRIR
ncbi:MAG: DUF4097 family beta strand repeat-containing protein [Longimicrobiales bacterium]